MKIISKLFLYLALLSIPLLHAKEDFGDDVPITIMDLPDEVLEYIFLIGIEPSTIDYETALQNFRAIVPALLTCRKFAQFREIITKKFIARYAENLCINSKDDNVMAGIYFSKLELLKNNLSIQHFFSECFIKLFEKKLIRNHYKCYPNESLNLDHDFKSSLVAKDEYFDEDAGSYLLNLPNEILLKIIIYNFNVGKPREAIKNIVCITDACKGFYRLKEKLITDFQNLFARYVVSDRIFDATTDIHLNVIRLLLRSSLFDINAKDLMTNENALLWSTMPERAEIAQFLIENGIDINARTKSGQNALMLTLSRFNEVTAQLLIERGIDIHVRNKWGENALMRAAIYGYRTIARLLIEKGIDIYAKSRQGKTALKYARIYDNLDIVKLLEDHMYKDTDSV